MKKLIATSAAALAVVASANAANIALDGTGIIGATNDTSTLGTLRDHIGGNNLGGAGRINDEVLTGVTVDTWGAGANTADFVGVTGLTIGAGEEITSVTLHGQNFGDGGWFGGDTVATAAAPTLQFTSNGGTTWTDFGGTVTENYASIASSAGLNANYVATFTFAGVTGVNGVRLVGAAGGDTDTDGFIGVNEFQVNTTTVAVPEPSSSALLGLGGLALILRRRK